MAGVILNLDYSSLGVKLLYQDACDKPCDFSDTLYDPSHNLTSRSSGELIWLTKCGLSSSCFNLYWRFHLCLPHMADKEVNETRILWGEWSCGHGTQQLSGPKDSQGKPYTAWITKVVGRVQKSSLIIYWIRLYFWRRWSFQCLSQSREWNTLPWSQD